MKNYDYLKIVPYEANNLDIAEEDMWVLNFNGKKHLKVNTFTKRLMDLFNGKYTLAEISEKLCEGGIAITEEDLVEFVDGVLLKNNILAGTERKKEIRLSFRFRVPLFESKRLYFILDRIRFMYQKKFVFVILAVCISIQIIAILQGDWNLYIKYKSAAIKPASVLVLFLIGTILHEIGHTTAARFYKINVGKIGIGLYLLMPVVFTDLSNIWSLERNKRIVVNIGGFYFSLMYASLLWIIGSITGNTNLLIVNMLVLITMFLNMNPLLRMDGYWVLCDCLGIVNINKKIYDQVIYIIKRLFGGPVDYSSDVNFKSNKMYAAYLILYALCNTVALIFGIISIINLILSNVQF